MTRAPALGPERPSVLLVDDRPENLLALTAVLEPLDVRLVTAGSGEEALRALLGEDFADELLRRAWESSPTGVVLVDTDGRIVQINPALSELMGTAAAVGTQLAERFHRDDRRTLVGVCQRVLVGGRPDGAELRMLDRDGAEVPVAVLASAVRDAHDDAGS